MDHFTEWTFEGDLNNIHEAYRAMYQQQESPGTEPVINQERMLVREKVDERQFEWYRDNNEFYYRLKQ